MAFNLTFETRRKAPVRAVAEERPLSLFSESQTSWVVFNPTDVPENDILSFSTSAALTQTESDSEAEAEEEEREEEDDDLIDHLQVSLSSRINEWQKATDASVSDNMASWDLDADLVSQVLDTSILRRVAPWYGDHYFENMSKADYAQYKRASAVLKKLLSRKDYNPRDPDILTRVLQLLQWQDLLRTSGSLVDDYIVNTLSRTYFKEPAFKDVEFSDTATSSSLVMCGGSSGNDI